MVPQVEGLTLRPEGATISFLLIHGFAARPDQVLSLAEFLAEQGISSFSVKIAGHGGTPENLSESTRYEWYQSVVEGLNEVKSWGMDKLFVAGLSLGGALSLYLAATESDIDGLVALSPAVFQKGFLKFFLPILKRIKPYRSLDLSYIQEMYEIHYWRLKREPLGSLHQLVKVMSEIQRKLPSIKIPTLIIQSGEDKTIDPNNGQFVFDRISSEDKKLQIIEGAEHVITCHSTRHQAFESILEFVQRITLTD